MSLDRYLYATFSLSHCLCASQLIYTSRYACVFECLSVDLPAALHLSVVVFMSLPVSVSFALFICLRLPVTRNLSIASCLSLRFIVCLRIFHLLFR